MPRMNIFSGQGQDGSEPFREYGGSSGQIETRRWYAEESSSALDEKTLKLRFKKFSHSLQLYRKERLLVELKSARCFLKSRTSCDHAASTNTAKSPEPLGLKTDIKQETIPLIVYKQLDGELSKCEALLAGPVYESFFRQLDTLSSLRRGDDTYLKHARSRKSPCVAYLKNFMDERLNAPRNYLQEETSACLYPLNDFGPDVSFSVDDVVGITICPPNNSQRPRKSVPCAHEGFSDPDLTSVPHCRSSDKRIPQKRTAQVDLIAETTIETANSGETLDPWGASDRSNPDSGTICSTRDPTGQMSFRLPECRSQNPSAPAYPKSSVLHSFTGVWRASTAERSKKCANKFIRAKLALAPFLRMFDFPSASVISALIYSDEASFAISDYFTMLESVRMCAASRQYALVPAEHRLDEPVESISNVCLGTKSGSNGPRNACEMVHSPGSVATPWQGRENTSASTASITPSFCNADSDALDIIRGKELIREWELYESRKGALKGSISELFGLDLAYLPLEKSEDSSKQARTTKLSFFKSLCWGKALVLFDYARATRLQLPDSVLVSLKSDVDSFLRAAETAIPGDDQIRSYTKLLQNRNKKCDESSPESNHVRHCLCVEQIGHSFNEGQFLGAIQLEVSALLGQE